MEKLTNIPWAAQDELYAELAKVSCGPVSH